MKAPVIAPGLRRRRDHASAQRPPLGALSWISWDSSWATDISAQPDPRVQDRVRDVHDQVDDDEDDREEEDASLQHRVVTVEDRVLEPAADAGPREDGLGENGSREQEAGLEADDRRDRQHGVPEHVPGVDRVRREALGPRRAYVVL